MSLKAELANPIPDRNFGSYTSNSYLLWLLDFASLRQPDNAGPDLMVK